MDLTNTLLVIIHLLHSAFVLTFDQAMPASLFKFVVRLMLEGT